MDAGSRQISESGKEYVTAHPAQLWPLQGSLQPWSLSQLYNPDLKVVMVTPVPPSPPTALPKPPFPPRSILPVLRTKLSAPETASCPASLVTPPAVLAASIFETCPSLWPSLICWVHSRHGLQPGQPSFSLVRPHPRGPQALLNQCWTLL